VPAVDAFGTSIVIFTGTRWRALAAFVGDGTARVPPPPQPASPQPSKTTRQTLRKALTAARLASAALGSLPERAEARKKRRRSRTC